MLKLLSKYSDSYKDVGSLLGENFIAGFQEQISANMSNYLDLTGQNGKWIADVGDIVTIKDVSNERIFSNPDGSVVKGTANQFGISGDNKFTAMEYNNGFLRLANENGESIGWVDRKQLNKIKSTLDNYKTYDNYNMDFDKDEYEEEPINKKKKKKYAHVEEVATFASGGRTPNNIDDGAFSILHSNEKILNADETETFDEIKELMTEIKSLYKSNNTVSSNYGNLYSNDLVNSYDLNRIQNMGNSYNNNDSHNQTIVNMTNHITNNNLREVGMNEKSFERMANKWMKNSGSKFK